MKTMAAAVWVLCLAAVFPGAAFAADGALNLSGKMAVDSSGMTVYTFDKDKAGSGKSMCNGPCAKSWPPVVAPAGTQPSGGLGVVTREDGTKQLSYMGKPLYHYSKDQAKGDMKGDNFKGVWHVVTP
jgi:predicted lipoprotein with Yx(FWY)xxD motif